MTLIQLRDKITYDEKPNHTVIDMAYVSQTDKKELAVDIKKVLNKHGVKATIGVRRHSTLTVKIKSGPIDFGKIDNYFGLNVNVYHINNHYTGVAREFLNELHAAMRGPKWFDESDIMTDYFHVSHYCDIEVLPSYVKVV